MILRSHLVSSSRIFFGILFLFFPIGDLYSQGDEERPVQKPQENEGGMDAGKEMRVVEGAADRDTSKPPQWQIKEVRRKEGVPPERALTCRECVLDAKGLPVRTYTEKLASRGTNVKRVEVALEDRRFEEISEEELEALGDRVQDLPSRIEPVKKVSYSRKTPYLKLSFVPLIKDPSGKVKKLVGHDIRLGGVERGSPTRSSRSSSFSANSVLRSGSWYKVGVTESGVHRLDREALLALGINVDSIDPARLDIYGNHFGMLPLNNDVGRPDDLKKNAIKVQAGNDGSLDPGDRILFYAKGPHVMERNDLTGLFEHKHHRSTDTAWYFLRVGSPSPKRVQEETEVTDPVDETIEAVNVFAAHEEDRVNLINSGKRWGGEKIPQGSDRSFTLLNGKLEPGSEVHVDIGFLARTLGSSNSSSFEISVNGGTSDMLTVSGVNDYYLADQGRFRSTELYHTVGSGEEDLTLDLSFIGHTPSSRGWLDHIVVNAEKELRVLGDQLAFRDTGSVGAGQVVRFRFQGSEQVKKIWDVSDPTEVRSIPFDRVSGSPKFRVHADSLRHFVAFDSDQVPEPAMGGKVPNQNLHASSQPDMVIVSASDFLPAAKDLADFHRQEGMDILLTTPREVYNEFGGGMRDITAIKDLMRMFYLRAGTDTSLMPDHLLLFGDGSFNNKLQRMDEKAIPTFQSNNSVSPTASYTSDDYFGLLDSTEGKHTSDLVDLGIGRIPVRSLSQARQTVNKIKSYARGERGLSSSGEHCDIGSSSLQDPNWQDLVVFIADDEDNNLHMRDADEVAEKVRAQHPVMNLQKIFLDAFQQTRASGGERYPAVNRRINERMERGALIVNYLGHGGERGLAKERILTQKMIREWENIENLPLFVTATCEFTRFDDHTLVSAGENALLNPNGGAMGLLSTVRVVYASQNKRLNKKLYNHALIQENGKPLRIGEIVRRTKVEVTQSGPNSVNQRKFLYFGDPALRLNMPEQKISVDSIDASPVGSPIDTIRALSEVTVSGSVLRQNGSIDTDFEGVVHPLVMDKRRTIETLANDGGNTMSFQLFNSWLNRGKASVNNGKFEFSFVVPKDIAYQYGNGRISILGKGKDGDAHGFTEDLIIGGTDTNARDDDQGPDIGIYLNDKEFVAGGTTDESPLMLAELKDESGINISSSGIGHNIKAILDGERSDAVVLNDHYRSSLDTYKEGEVKYRFEELEEGKHELKLKAWDVHNNASEKSVDFVVANSAELALDHVLNYPNPFTTHTEFFFEHNQACNYLDVRIRIFTVSGKVVETIHHRVRSKGFRSEGIAWDGTDRFGDALGKGVYVYELKVETPDGKEANKFEKLVLLK